MTKLSIRIYEVKPIPEGKQFFRLIDQMVNQHTIYNADWEPTHPNEVNIFSDDHFEPGDDLSDSGLPNLLDQILEMGTLAGFHLRGHLREPFLTQVG